MPQKIAFLGAKEIGAYCLRQLLKSAPVLDLKILCVRSRETATGREIYSLAKKHRIPCLNSLDDLPEVDFIISVQHHELLRQKDIAKAKKIAINLHLAPLPEYRGCNQFSFALLDDAAEFGVTIHQMDTRIDHGAILFEKRFPVLKNCWVNELYEQTVEAAKSLFSASLPDLIAGNYQLKPQQKTGQKPGALHFRKEIQSLKEIPLDLPKEEMKKRIRATMMPGFEPPFCRINNEKVYFSKEDC